MLSDTLSLILAALVIAAVFLVLAVHVKRIRILHRMRDLEAHRQAMTTAFPDPIFIVNREGRYLDGPTDQNDLVMVPDSGPLLGSRVQDNLPPDLAAEFMRVIAEALDTGKPVTLEYQLDVPAGLRWFEGRAAPIRYTGDTPDTVIWIARNITARKLAELERERLISELDAFAHTVAHDLKNPLHLAVGYTSMLLDEYPRLAPDEARVYLQPTQDALTRMNNIIEGLLLLSGVRKMESIPSERLEMRSIVVNAYQMVQHITAEYGGEMHIPDQLPPALGYAPWVEEVWVNYLSNALKYGGRPPQVTIGGTALPGGAVRYWVQDNGPGISDEQKARLFVPFTQLQQVQIAGKGHGLGLSIVQRIVERLGGEVGVESAPGEGSRFWFTLPAADLLPDTPN